MMRLLNLVRTIFIIDSLGSSQFNVNVVAGSLHAVPLSYDVQLNDVTTEVVPSDNVENVLEIKNEGNPSPSNPPSIFSVDFGNSHGVVSIDNTSTVSTTACVENHFIEQSENVYNVRVLSSPVVICIHFHSFMVRYINLIDLKTVIYH